MIKEKHNVHWTSTETFFLWASTVLTNMVVVKNYSDEDDYDDVMLY